MNKMKNVNKKGVSQIIIKSQKGQQLSQNEVYFLGTNRVSGLLHLDVVQRGAAFKLIYDTTGFITLKKFLAMPLNKEAFAKMLQTILLALKAMDDAFLNQRCLLMDFDNVMVNPITQEIFFVYVPVQFFESPHTLKEFLLDIIRHCTFVTGEDNGYVKEYINILNRGINFSIFELEEYINTILGKESKFQRVVKCPRCGAQLDKNAKFCMSCGAKVSADEKNANAVYDPLAAPEEKPRIQHERREIEPPVHKEQTPSFREEIPQRREEISHRRIDTSDLSHDVDTLDDDEIEETTIIGTTATHQRPETTKVPYMIRKSTGEKVWINRASFRIGRSQNGCDYVIADNKAVGRSHAEIIVTSENVFVVDLESTNKTYVNGERLQPNRRYKVSDGAIVSFANEKFEIYPNR